MSIKKFYLVLLGAILISGLSWICVCFFVDLLEYKWMALFLFYGTFFLFSATVSSFLTTVWLIKIKKITDLFSRVFYYSLKNGVTVAIFLTLSLWLQSQRLLNGLVIFLLLILFLFIKLFVLSIYKKNELK